LKGEILSNIYELWLITKIIGYIYQLKVEESIMNMLGDYVKTAKNNTEYMKIRS